MTIEPTPAPSPPPMRASDRDREQVAAVLQKAMSEGRITVGELETRLDSVYAAKTLAELEPVMHDLPVAGLSLSKPAPVSVPTAAAVSGLAISAQSLPKANLVAIFSGVERKNPWVVPAHLNVVAIFGGVELDFTKGQLTAMETTMNVTAIMGGVEIRVPEGVTVHVEGVGIMGGFDDRANQHYGPEAPVLRIKGAAIMGGVEVRGPKKKQIQS